MATEADTVNTKTTHTIPKIESLEESMYMDKSMTAGMRRNTGVGVEDTR